MRICSVRSPARPMLRPILLAGLCVVLQKSVLRADEPSRPPTGEVRLGSGRVVDYTIHFDRNSLRDSVRLGQRLIAVTSSVALVGFELPAVRLVRERIDTEEVRCLGRGQGAAILAGLSDGRVCRVDPATLTLTELTKLPASPQWLGWGQAAGNRPAGLVVVTRPTRPVDRDGRHWDVPFSVVHDLATGKTFALEDEATTFLLDAAGRIWLGADRGEWAADSRGSTWPKGRSRPSSRRHPANPKSKPSGKAFMVSSSSRAAMSGPSAARRTWASTRDISHALTRPNLARCSHSSLPSARERAPPRSAEAADHTRCRGGWRACSSSPTATSSVSIRS